MRCLQAPAGQAPHPDCQQHRTQGVEPENGDTRCSTDRACPGASRLPSKAQGPDKKVPQAPAALTSMIVDTE